MVKILPSNAGGVGSIPGQGAKISHASRPENQNINNRSDIIRSSKKILIKGVHIKKKKILKKRKVSSSQQSTHQVNKGKGEPGLEALCHF